MNWQILHGLFVVFGERDVYHQEMVKLIEKAKRNIKIHWYNNEERKLVVICPISLQRLIHHGPTQHWFFPKVQMLLPGSSSSEALFSM